MRNTNYKLRKIVKQLCAHIVGLSPDNDTHLVWPHQLLQERTLYFVVCIAIV